MNAEQIIKIEKTSIEQYVHSDCNRAYTHCKHFDKYGAKAIHRLCTMEMHKYAKL